MADAWRFLYERLSGRKAATLEIDAFSGGNESSQRKKLSTLEVLIDWPPADLSPVGLARLLNPQA